jgi:NADPH-dependent glutamate synthase beta subunit-like oxidoreductase
MNWQPLGFETDSTGKLCGVKIRHAEFAQTALLAVDLVIEAMGLEVSAPVRAAFSTGPDVALTALTINERFQTNLDRVYAAGAMVNGGASVAQCVAEGIAAASAIQRMLAGEIPLS